MRKRSKKCKYSGSYGETKRHYKLIAQPVFSRFYANVASVLVKKFYASIQTMKCSFPAQTENKNKEERPVPP